MPPCFSGFATTGDFGAFDGGGVWNVGSGIGAGASVARFEASSCASSKPHCSSSASAGGSTGTGIGAVTNLSDGYPWGIWIAYDVVVGTALGASGFTVAFVTYILNRGSYHPLVRPALLTALFGYLMAAASVFFDSGRYWEAWHIFLPGYVQFNSVLAEVALCIMAYTVVLFIEFVPADTRPEFSHVPAFNA